MRKDGLWHPRLASIVTAMAHTDTLVIADAGLPVPAGVEVVDLVWGPRQPELLPVLQAVLAELIVEAAMVASELTHPELSAGIGERLAGVRLSRVPHEELKRLVGAARAVVRTGETTPYGNVLLSAGVAF